MTGQEVDDQYRGSGVHALPISHHVHGCAFPDSYALPGLHLPKAISDV